MQIIHFAFNLSLNDSSKGKKTQLGLSRRKVILADKGQHYLNYIFCINNEILQINALCVILCCFYSLVFLVVKQDLLFCCK